MNKLIREIARFIYMDSKYTWDMLSDSDKQYLRNIYMDSRCADAQAVYRCKEIGITDDERYRQDIEALIKKLIPCFFKEEV